MKRKGSDLENENPAKRIKLTTNDESNVNPSLDRDCWSEIITHLPIISLSPLVFVSKTHKDLFDKFIIKELSKKLGISATYVNLLPKWIIRSFNKTGYVSLLERKSTVFNSDFSFCRDKLLHDLNLIQKHVTLESNTAQHYNNITSSLSKEDPEQLEIFLKCWGQVFYKSISDYNQAELWSGTDSLRIPHSWKCTFALFGNNNCFVELTCNFAIEHSSGKHATEEILNIKLKKLDDPQFLDPLENVMAWQEDIGAQDHNYWFDGMELAFDPKKIRKIREWLNIQELSDLSNLQTAKLLMHFIPSTQPNYSGIDGLDVKICWDNALNNIFSGAPEWPEVEFLVNVMTAKLSVLSRVDKEFSNKSTAIKQEIKTLLEESIYKEFRDCGGLVWPTSTHYRVIEGTFHFSMPESTQWFQVTFCNELIDENEEQCTFKYSLLGKEKEETTSYEEELTFSENDTKLIIRDLGLKEIQPQDLFELMVIIMHMPSQEKSDGRFAIKYDWSFLVDFIKSGNSMNK